MSTTKKFVLCDGSVNDYRFNINIQGIDLTRFLANPVMLAEHENELDAVIGKWQNIGIENGKLVAEPLFDTADELSARIAGKVERGFINAVSIGFMYADEDMTANADGTWTLAKCELYECSFVAIGSNKNAVKLFSKTTDKLLKGEAIKLTLSSLFQKTQKTDIQKMGKITLAANVLPVLGLTLQEVEQSELEASIMKLSTAKREAEDRADALQAKVECFEIEEQKTKQLRAENLVMDAIASGKLTASTKDEFEKMAIQNFELASKIIGGMKPKISLSTLIKNGVIDEDGESFDYLQRYNTAKLASIKANNPEKYAQLSAEYALGKRYKK